MAAPPLPHAHRGRNARRCSPSPSTFPWPSSTPLPAWLRREGFNRLGPAPLDPGFDPAVAIANLAARPDLELGLALLDQSAIAGLGNVFKSEVAFACGLNPFRKVATLSADQLAALVATARKFLLANVTETSGHHRTTGRIDHEEFL